MKYSKQQIQRYIKKAQKYLGIDESELVTVLGMEKDLAFKLYKCASIETIEDLSICTRDYISKRFIDCNEDASKDTIENYIDAAKKYMDFVKDNKLVTVLKMDRNLAFKLYNYANIKTIDDLSTSRNEYIVDKLTVCSIGVNSDIITKCIEDANEYMKIDQSSELIKILPEKKDLVYKLSHFAGVNTIEELKKYEKWEDLYEKLGVSKCDITKEEIEDLLKNARES